MFDLGMGELMVIGVVALILIGPKDLPKLFQTMGRFTAKMRAMAREFSSAMEAAAQDSGVKDVAKDIRDLKSVTSPGALGLDRMSDAMDRFEKWDPLAGSRPSGGAAKGGNPTLGPAPKPAATPSLAAAPTTTTRSDPKPRGPSTAGLDQPKPAQTPAIDGAGAGAPPSEPEAKA